MSHRLNPFPKWLGQEEQTGRPEQPEADTLKARQQMVRQQLKVPDRGITEPRVLTAMEKVPRHKFMPEKIRAEAYDDTALSIGHGQTISQPFIVAFMTEQLQPEPQGPDVRTSYATVKNIAEDGNVETGDFPFLFADGESVEQGLSWVLMGSVTCVHHVGVKKASEKVRRPGCLMADDNDIGVERFQGAMISALSRLAESSKLTRVRVEGSTKKFTTVLP